MTPGSTILQARKAKGLTQRAIADHLNISVQAVSQWENDKANVTPDRLADLADLLEVDAFDLMPESFRKSAAAAKRIMENAKERLIESDTNQKDPIFLLPVAKGLFDIIELTERATQKDNFTKIETHLHTDGNFHAFNLLEDIPVVGLKSGCIAIFDTDEHPVPGDVVLYRLVSSPVVMSAKNRQYEQSPLGFGMFDQNGQDGSYRVTPAPADDLPSFEGKVTIIVATLVELRSFTR